jgi:PQQ-dependent dehydrogenase (methanol/ethanol family)
MIQLNTLTLLVLLITPFTHIFAQEKMDWLHYGNDLGQNRFIDNDSINLSNIKQLRLKWMFQTGMTGSFENTPLVENGVMYVSTPYNHVYAIDARTGLSLWRYRYSLGLTNFCCGPNNRGLALNDEAVFMTTLDAYLVAINKKTGKQIWKQKLEDAEYGYSGTEAPLIVGDKIITGIAGAEYGIRGFITAHDANDGKLLWKWYTIPDPTEKQPDGTMGWYGNFQEKADGINPLNRNIELEKEQIASGEYKDAWKFGGGSAWTTKSYDPETGHVYAVIGNPGPDLDGSVRPGDNRWSNSLVALDSETGKLIWGYQYLPHDVWDLDSASPPILTKAKNNEGLMTDVIVHAGKTGWVYIHDRETGELIRRSEPMVEHQNLFALPTVGQGTEMLPGANGGVNWSPGAINPYKNHAYYANLHQPMYYEVRSVPWRKGRLWLGGAFKGVPGKKQTGNISAVDLNSGELVWQHITQQPMIGGTLATAGDLVFTGEDNGLFVALNANTGEKVWQFQTGAGVNAAPMGFVLDGVLHIVVAAGGNAQINTSRGGTVLVFTVE